jgi:hypothetical protein
MKQLLMHVFNKSKQYVNRIFYTCTSDTKYLHYSTVFTVISTLDRYIESKVKNGDFYVTMISNNILFKSMVYMYCYFSGTKLLMISSKFAISQIVNTMLQQRGKCILFLDNEVLSKIRSFERDEGIDVMHFFSIYETVLSMSERILDSNNFLVDPEPINSVIKKGHKKGYERGLISTLSPGTSSEPTITNVLPNTIEDSISNLAFFMGLKPSDKVSVIADFEFFAGIYTILGLLTGVHFVLPETDNNTTGEEIRANLVNSHHKPNVIFISSNNFKKIWDTIILNVYSKKLYFIMAKYWLTKGIVNWAIRKELRSILGQQVTKVHILNEELGFSVLDILKKSRIMFTSSYGFLEQGNFTAFKNPEVFKHKNFIYKPGGTILKSTEEFGFYISSSDNGSLIPNISNQGDRKFLYIYSHKDRDRGIQEAPSLDLIERSIKDTWLIRDCFLQRMSVLGKSDEYTYNLYVEVRDELLDSKMISWQRMQDTIKIVATELDRNSFIKITHMGIIKFNAMRNVAEKLQYYNM